MDAARLAAQEHRCARRAPCSPMHTAARCSCAEPRRPENMSPALRTALVCPVTFVSGSTLGQGAAQPASSFTPATCSRVTRPPRVPAHTKPAHPPAVAVSSPVFRDGGASSTRSSNSSSNSPGRQKDSARRTAAAGSYRSPRKEARFRKFRRSPHPPAQNRLSKDARISVDPSNPMDHDIIDVLCPNVALESCPALVLNADFQPLSYSPLSLWPWQEVVKAVFSDRVNIVATYDVEVRSPSVILPLPSVISLKRYQKPTKTPPFTRFNVFLRDGFSCQYCAQKLPTTDLTFDHVVPRCLGGKTSWTNVVSACCKCNHKKGRKLLKQIPEMGLLKEPIQPTNMQLQEAARLFPPRGNLHESWRDYLYWNESLETES